MKSLMILPILRKAQRAFTLLEMMVVMAIVGILATTLSVVAMPDHAEYLQRDVQKLARLIEIAHSQSRLQGLNIALEANTEGYRFVVLKGKQQREWVLLDNIDSLRPRSWQVPPKSVTLKSQAEQSDPLTRLEFGQEPLLPELYFVLEVDNAKISLEGDGGSLVTKIVRP